MTAISGRRARLYLDGVPIAGVRATNLTINNEPLDQTDKYDNGWRTFVADDVGLRTVSATVEGVIKSNVINELSTGAGTALLRDCIVDIQGITAIVSDIHLQGVELGAEHSDVVTFSATLESSGEVEIAPTLTPPIAVAGAPEVGVTVSVTLTAGVHYPAEWSGDITFTYQWQTATVDHPANATWTNIVGATSSTYELAAPQVGLFVRCRIIPTLNGVSGIAFSETIGPVTTL